MSNVEPQVALVLAYAALSAPSIPAHPEQTIYSSFSLPSRGNMVVSISIQADHDSEAYGLNFLFPTVPIDNFPGFPVCEGHVHTTKQGYASVYGWTQLWKNNENDGLMSRSVRCVVGFEWGFLESE